MPADSAKRRIGRFGQADLVRPDQRIVVSDRSKVASSTRELQRSSTRLKPRNISGPQGLRPPRNDDDVFAPGIEVDRAILSGGREGSDGVVTEIAGRGVHHPA